MNSARSRLAVLVATTVAILLGFAAVLPPRFYSIDIHIWERVTQILMSGQNPYQTTPLLYYPPLWMQVLFVLGKISSRTHISLAHLIQVTLTGVDAAIVVLTYLLLRSLGIAERRAFWIALVGIALNPISIFMAIEHGNFDSMVGLSALGAAFSSAAGVLEPEGPPGPLRAFAFGFGSSPKPVPLVLAPLRLSRGEEPGWPP